MGIRAGDGAQLQHTLWSSDLPQEQEHEGKAMTGVCVFRKLLGSAGAAKLPPPQRSCVLSKQGWLCHWCCLLAPLPLLPHPNKWTSALVQCRQGPSGVLKGVILWGEIQKYCLGTCSHSPKFLSKKLFFVFPGSCLCAAFLNSPSKSYRLEYFPPRTNLYYCCFLSGGYFSSNTSLESTRRLTEILSICDCWWLEKEQCSQHKAYFPLIVGHSSCFLHKASQADHTMECNLALFPGGFPHVCVWGAIFTV